MAYDRREWIESRELEPQERLLLELFDQREHLTIFDVGACEGENSVRYARLFPRADVYSVEPLPTNIKRIEDAVRTYGVRNVTPIQACLSSGEDAVEFHVSSGRPPGRDSELADWDFGNKSSSLLPPGETLAIYPWLEFTETVRIRTSRLDEVAARRAVTQIDFLHLDVQGAELLVLEGAGPLLSRVWTLWLEVEAVPLYAGQPLRREIERFLDDRGFVKLLDTVGDVSGDQFWAKAGWLRSRKIPFWRRLRRALHA
ncbi:MAG: FkbM family methyltransferase [Actinomycetes bacterium]